MNFFQPSWNKRLSYLGAIALLVFSIFWLGCPRAKAGLAQGDAITDPVAILRYALPIENADVRRLQTNLEAIEREIRRRRWSSAIKEAKAANLVAKYNDEKILQDIPSTHLEEAKTLISELQADLPKLIEATESKDKEAVAILREELLDRVGRIEAMMVVGFPFEVPEDYAALPQLKGRARVEIVTNKGTLEAIVDGYNAPVNAGNFVDLVQRGFYDGLEFYQTQDYIVQVGDPPGKAAGFIDPDTEKYRAIPIEVKIADEELPIYEFTLESIGLYLTPPVLPFNAYGAIALGHPAADPNGGSSQIFFFLYDSELTPPGFNLLDGRYSVFGYVVEGSDVLAELKAGDRIISATVTTGSENLQP
ncbi:MAG: peptidylprolyl isomerase [Cyanobacteria bacterium SBLK]|nr:peptidylprolyl isomerase [Cyanobacteria bacterium SBLK]